MSELNPLIIGSIVGAVVIFIIFIIFYAARFNKFKTNEYVIHFRRGKVKRAGTGGTAWLMPLLDEIVVIPTTVQQTLLEADEQVVSHEYQDVAITAYLYWRVTDPKIAYEKVSWIKSDADFIEKTLKNATEAIIRTTCASLPIEQILR